MANEHTPAKAKSAALQNVSLSNAENMMGLAKQLADFIKDQQLTTRVGGKDHVNVEGWQFAGSLLGIVPIIQSVNNISNSEEIKYEAKVRLLNINTSSYVGAGYSVCSNKEQGKKYNQEFAIASMAQTRAIGKAFRNMLAWLITAAGYEVTPAEEMDYSGNEPAKQASQEMQKAEQPITQPATEKPAIASNKQREELVRLLHNPVITSGEKAKGLTKVAEYTEEVATKVIAHLKKVIADREAEQDGAPEVAAEPAPFQK